ncbi:cytochrome c [Haliangium sp.]|uniref:cytochrome c n=1 Tax=Haliangium sp. TaxID=2663208 RepID=UPI003D0C7807
MRSVQLHEPTVAHGKMLFGQCVGCHGSEGQGVMGAGPRLNSESFLAAASDEYLVRTISNGRAGTTMVPWGQSMSRSDIASIIAYMRSWHPVDFAILDESPLNGDEVRGREIFRDICASCHGRTGAGYQETANGTGIARAAFLREVSDGFLRYIIKNGKTQTQMKGFDERDGTAVASLGPQQIDDVIVYLRNNAW